METKDVLVLALAFYKDRIQGETIARFHSEFDKLLEAETDARRLKARSLVLHLAKLKNTLQQFEWTYNRIREKVGGVEAVDEYIKKIKVEIKKISYDKNNHKFQ